jgi:outer membrane protein assembly factor BamB
MRNLVILASLTLLISCTQKKQNITEWRGPGRTGVYNEQNLLKTWNDSGPAEIMLIDNIGNGYGSPIITDESIFLTGEIDSSAILYCFDLKGNSIWKTNLGIEWTESFQGSRSAPTLIDDLIYVSTGMGNLFCVEKTTGAIKWSKDFVKDFNGGFPMFGLSEAPAVQNNKVFFTVGGADTNVVALDRFTGEFLWVNKGFAERAAYNQPAIIELPTRSIFVTFSAYHLMGFDCETGELLWSHEQDNTPLEKREPGMGDTHGNTIIFSEGNIYYAEGDGNCGVKLKLSDDGTSISEVWRNPGFDTYMGGIVKIDNLLYGCGYRKNQLVSVDAATGALTDSLKIGRGAIIAAEDMLYYYTEKGIMNLVGLSEGKMNEVSSFRISKGTKEHFSHPVTRNGVLYIRRGNALMAYDVRSQS